MKDRITKNKLCWHLQFSITVIFLLMSLTGTAFNDPDTECIIITPQKYKNFADQLKIIHESQSWVPSGGISTRVITTEEIAGKLYESGGRPPLAPLPDGLCPEWVYVKDRGRLSCQRDDCPQL